MVEIRSMEDIPQFDDEPKAILKTVFEKYEDMDLDNITIEASRLPEILSSLVPAWDKEELATLVAAVDEDETGKLDLSKTSQIIIYFLKKHTERSKEFTRVTLKISTQMCIAPDAAMMIVYFYPQIIKAIDEGTCILQ